MSLSVLTDAHRAEVSARLVKGCRVYLTSAAAFALSAAAPVAMAPSVGERREVAPARRAGRAVGAGAAEAVATGVVATLPARPHALSWIVVVLRPPDRTLRRVAPERPGRPPWPEETLLTSPNHY